ncbi:DUF1489 family protein [Rhodospirillum rubrum]|uniref:DUF1489 family protein n=1 Tax=Rhodospirillum rubrum (strain ATCC 11170 / ATH 1.1.1 / DSM 467 / LMG 4362 / NCIMB 8255 / S1) TaxID=269796 RepID=Q2RS33_RHORT|nr:DUF1489 domain-containing protein [Rhodospirillum rubrum]ABC23062.1 conserved hypothetical protein [Rhodospirillum rubrum ATCC 11170]AEO48791.1 hypothetical protein F11_11635 [Rhodospirillum rubrum F11]MBK5954689.1 hypothetical protein [Rhodospirillum rubrum]QXG79046.1 DUF1489 domain-containing protein [Rhodospirillum rubrum]HAQ00647.1 DUF1489 domain-containing protein [Rhodospirillum rubrum]
MTDGPLHLIKLSVGSQSVEGLARWQAGQLAARGEVIHPTRRAPRRASEILAGGSIYWVFDKAIRARQPILDLRIQPDEEGREYCAIVLDPALVATETWPHRPFQGWRYLGPDKAPPDRGGPGIADPEMPAAMASALKDLGFL